MLHAVGNFLMMSTLNIYGRPTHVVWWEEGRAYPMNRFLIFKNGSFVTSEERE